MQTLNETHHPELKSWVQSANDGKSDFPIQNLPFAVFRVKGSDQRFRGGVAIGDQIVDLARLAASERFSGIAQQAALACAKSQLNEFMSMGPEAWSSLRQALSNALREGSSAEADFGEFLIPMAQAEYELPCQIGDYTDFYTSIHHATSVGALFRPDNPLLPNYKWVPIGYHGRSSSIGISGQKFHRPKGQVKAPDADSPRVIPCNRLDYELEMGIYIGQGNLMGETVALDEADQHVFGLCLFNDWSARDLQAWEYQPLGPFLAKNFASTVSPWIVTTEALVPYRKPWKRDEADPQPLPYLDSVINREQGALDIELEVGLETATMRDLGEQPAVLSRSNFIHSYWTVNQLVAHHTVNGCNMRAGDLLGSGTQSGPEPEEAGSMLELSGGGKNPITLSNGEVRTFIEDHDVVILRGWCRSDRHVRIGFGEVRAQVLPAKD